MVVDTIVHGSVRTSNRSTHRRTLRMRAVASFKRLREQLRAWKANHFPAVEKNEDDWALGEFEQPKALPPAQQRAIAPGPSALPNDPQGRAHTQRFQVPQQPQQRPAHPPFARPTNATGHVLDRFQIRLVELRSDPNLTAGKANWALQDLIRDLADLAAGERSVSRRSAQNVERAAQIGRALDAAAQAPGVEIRTETVVGPDGVERTIIPGAVQVMSSGAERVGDPTPTAQFQAITDDMQDPRSKLLDPVEPGSVVTSDAVDEPEQTPSPVHSETTGTQPAVPAQRPEGDPLPKREFVGGEVERPFAVERNEAEGEREQVAS
jgi:hypothetical protein